jgi:hypothetical protein
MTWAANPQRRRAFKVLREVKSRDALVLVTWCGATFEEDRARLLGNGYDLVKRRPAYAEPGHYTPANRR